MSTELADECDYRREAKFLKAFGSPNYLGNDPRFKIPWVWGGSSSTVLVMERVEGLSVGEADISNLSQDDRNKVGDFKTTTFIANDVSLPLDFCLDNRAVLEGAFRIPYYAD